VTSVWRHLLPAVAVLALGGLFAFALVRIGSGALDVHEIKSPLIGRSAPAFDLPSVVDPAKRVATKSLAGRMYVLNVWGTWCGACRDEHSALLAIARTNAVPIIGMDWRDEHDQAVSYLSELGNPYAEVAADADGRAAIDWGVYGAPETFLVSASGTVLEKHIGALTDEIWKTKFVPHLAKGSP